MASAGDSGTASSKRSSKSVEEKSPDALSEEELASIAESMPTQAGLSPEEWARVASSFDTTPQMIIGALEPGNTYMRDAVAQLVAAFLAAPAEKE